MSLRSPAFEPDSPIPARYSHKAGDVSPPLTWDEVPDGTAEFALLVEDPDAPMKGSFVHWVLCGLDPQRRSIAEGETPAEATVGVNGFGERGYLGPAPPAGHGPHHYVFRLLALDQRLQVSATPSSQEVQGAAAGHVLAEARLVATYEQ